MVVVATMATYLGQWEDAPYNVKVLGKIPSGLPTPSIPSFPNVRPSSLIHWKPVGFVYPPYSGISF